MQEILLFYACVVLVCTLFTWDSIFKVIKKLFKIMTPFSNKNQNI